MIRITGLISIKTACTWIVNRPTGPCSTIINTNLLLQTEFFSKRLLLYTVSPPGNFIKPEIKVISEIGTGFAPGFILKIVEIVVENLEAIQVSRGKWIEMTDWGDIWWIVGIGGWAASCASICGRVVLIISNSHRCQGASTIEIKNFLKTSTCITC